MESTTVSNLGLQHLHRVPLHVDNDRREKGLGRKETKDRSEMYIKVEVRKQEREEGKGTVGRGSLLECLGPGTVRVKEVLLTEEP